jgi:hypothetical protein
MGMGVERWWNDSDRGKAKYRKKTKPVAIALYLLQMSQRGTKPGPQQSEIGDYNRLSHARLLTRIVFEGPVRTAQ